MGLQRLQDRALRGDSAAAENEARIREYTALQKEVALLQDRVQILNGTV